MSVDVIVTPLEPPFSGKVLRISFENYDKELVVAEEDGRRLQALFDAAKMAGREVVLSPAEDGKIRVSIVQ